MDSNSEGEGEDVEPVEEPRAEDQETSAQQQKKKKKKKKTKKKKAPVGDLSATLGGAAEAADTRHLQSFSWVGILCGSLLVACIGAAVIRFGFDKS